MLHNKLVQSFINFNPNYSHDRTKFDGLTYVDNLIENLRSTLTNAVFNIAFKTNNSKEKHI